ncbi:MAG: 23S rRNA (uracil(1939)-C(5))-methyltransferase RlmD, partial [bacterium]|nr:23S rRNA (uracil(1939)-C(5))-methyltransferase RlmD [bacterium]
RLTGLRFGADREDGGAAMTDDAWRDFPTPDEKSRSGGAVRRRITSISVSVNTERTNVIMGKEIRLLWGNEKIQDTLGGITYSISPLSFYQVNPEQTEKLYEITLNYARLTGDETVWDLYCGIGTISLFMARRARYVYGVEVIPQAVEDARENARANGIDNARFYVGRVEEVLPAFYEGQLADVREETMRHPDVIVVDPPRKGCDEKCLATMLAMQPERIVYVSCDSATLARDLKTLCAGGYELKRVRAVDQFGQSVHVETVCLLSKLNVEHHIEVELDLSEMDLTKAESKATYEEIRAYVKEHFGLYY